MDNSVGKIVDMERNKVDDNKDQTCSTGLHFCGQSYLSHFGGERVVIVKVHPADVVSIPSDYNGAKGRACRYEVIGEVGASEEDTSKAFPSQVQANASNNIYVAPKPVTKQGSTDFYRGYTDGFEIGTYDGKGKDYAEGFDKGYTDSQNGVTTPRYEYHVPKASTYPNVTWPNPKV
jgi:hypothetical protein